MIETVVVQISPEQWQNATLESLADPYLQTRLHAPAVLLEFCGPEQQRVALLMLQDEGMSHAAQVTALSQEWAEIAMKPLTAISDQDLQYCAEVLFQETALHFPLPLLRQACDLEPLRHPPQIAASTIHQVAARHGVAGMPGIPTRLHLKFLLGRVLGLGRPWVQRPPDHQQWTDAPDAQADFDRGLAIALGDWIERKTSDGKTHQPTA